MSDDRKLLVRGDMLQALQVLSNCASSLSYVLAVPDKVMLESGRVRDGAAAAPNMPSKGVTLL